MHQKFYPSGTFCESRPIAGIPNLTLPIPPAHLVAANLGLHLTIRRFDKLLFAIRNQSCSLDI
jgi:hypothetical protein